MNTDSPAAGTRDPKTNMALHTFIRENCQVKSYLTNTFSTLPSFKTPPSAFKAKTPFNPFNQGLKERLGFPTFSPTVFEKVASPREISSHSELLWTIDDISKCNPAQIDEDSHAEPNGNDNEESEVQEAIDRYFSQTHMPSPWNFVPKDFNSPMTETPGSVGRDMKKENSLMSSTPKKQCMERTKSVTTVCTQTNWSFPPTLPSDVEELLRPYLNVIQENSVVVVEEEESLSVSTLRRKLDFSKAHSPSQRSEFDESMACSNHLDNEFLSPQCHGTPLPLFPDISPILNSNEKTRSKFSTRLDFTQNMHVASPFSANDEKRSDDEDRDDDLAMSILINCSPPTKEPSDRNGKFLLPQPLASVSDTNSQDTGYQTYADMTGSTTASWPSAPANGEPAQEIACGDITNGWIGFSDELSKAQKHNRKAASTPTKQTDSDVFL